jgi:hypothetical protein
VEAAASKAPVKAPAAVEAFETTAVEAAETAAGVEPTEPTAEATGVEPTAPAAPSLSLPQKKRERRDKGNGQKRHYGHIQSDPFHYSLLYFFLEPAACAC